MKRSGIILELNQKQAIVMTSDAEFITIKREPQMYVGAPVEFNQPSHFGFAFFQVGNIGKNLRTTGLAGLTLAAVAVVTFAFFFRVNDFPSAQNPYAYVTVDINPSVELTVNQKILVIEVRDLNKDGRILLKGTAFKNMPLTKALATIVNRAEQAHYFKPNAQKYLLVSGVTTQESPGKSGALEKSISQCQKQLAEKKVQMQYVPATLSQRKLALSNHLSTGRYALMSYTKNAGRGMDMKTAKTETIGRLLDQAGLLKNSPNAQLSKTVSGDPAPGNSKVHPTNLPKQENKPTRNSADQTNQEKPKPTLPNSFSASNGSIPTLRPVAGVTVTPEPETLSPADVRLASAISNAYKINVSQREIADLRVNQKLGYGEIGLLYSLAHASGKTIADILALRQNDLSWDAIAKSLGLKVSGINRKNSAVLKAAKLPKEDQKIKEQSKNEEPGNSGDKPQPTKGAPGNSDSHSNSNSNSNSSSNSSNQSSGNRKNK